jgi:hypothetical protein
VRVQRGSTALTSGGSTGFTNPGSAALTNGGERVWVERLRVINPD